MTLALYQLTDGRVFALDFGEPPMRELSVDEKLDMILTDVEAHRTALWQLNRGLAGVALAQRLGRTSAGPEQPSAPEVVIPLLKALGRVGAGGSVALAVRHLRHPDRGVQLAAIEALGRIGTELEEHELTPFLRSGVPELERAAVLALSHFPTEAGLPLVELAAAKRASLADVAGIYAEQLRIKRAQDPDAYVRAYLGYAHREDLVPQVPYLFEPLVRAAAVPEHAHWVVYLWSAACDRLAARIMATMLSEPRAPIELRRLSARAMGRIGVRGAGSILIEQLQSSDPELQRNCVVALGLIGRSKALVPLLSTWPAQGGALHLDIRIATYRLALPGGPHQLLSLFEAFEPLPRLFLVHGEEMVEGYHPVWIRAELASASQLARRDALLIFASYCPDDDVLETLGRIGRTDPDEPVRELAVRLYHTRYNLEEKRGTLRRP